MNYKLLLLLVLQLSLYAHGQQISPKREFRAVWIATVQNIDWPTKPGPVADQHLQEFIKLLDFHQANGMNAVVVQIRPAADAFYKSSYEPWSHWLTGQQGMPLRDDFDPLTTMIEETHKRCMEFHAWLNPYRANLDTANHNLAPNHVVNAHPEWILKYGKQQILDPAIPEVRAFVTNVVTDIVKRYDVDAIHFDDYFYPYKIKDVDFPDTLSFALYNRGFDSTRIADWRRDNVDLIIKMLHDSIKAYNPRVKFGISPFGIWKNKSTDPNGSDTQGYTNYEGLYADILLWLRNGWIDYVVPQIYWEIGRSGAAFEVLAKWWSENNYGKHLYIGQAAYRADEKSTSKAWQNPSELPNQIRLIRNYREISGSVFFSSKSLVNNKMGITDSLRQGAYPYKALVPAMTWIDKTPPLQPAGLSKQRLKNAYKLTWKSNAPADSVWFYAVYRFTKKQTISTDNPKCILSFVTTPEITINSKPAIFKKRYNYLVTAIDRNNNESVASSSLLLKLKD